MDNIKRFFDRLRYIGEFKRSVKNPLRVQRNMLLKILKENKKTEYGQKYDFSNIRSIKEFQKKVPIVDYDDILPYIQRMKDGEKNILVSKDVIYFATSSGTTSEPKFIPITSRRLDDFKREFFLWGWYVLKDYLKMLTGKTLYFAAGHNNGKTKSGIIYGNISGFHVKNLPWYFKKKMVLNAEVYNIKDPDKRMRTIAIEALKVKNISQLAFTFPIEAIKFFEYINEHREELIKEVKKSDSYRAKELEKIIDFKPIIIWPNLCLINCIKSGMNLLYLEHLLKIIGKKIDIRDPGVYASEGRVTNGFSNESNTSFISASFNFFEFKEKDKNGNFGSLVTIDKLSKGKEYSVIITTNEGLYRYDLGDIFRVVGFEGKLPVVEFVGRDKFLDIAGEHSPEYLLVKGVKDAADKLKLKYRGFTIIPYFKNSDEDLKYEILFESIGKLIPPDAMDLLREIESNFQKTILTYKKSRNEFDRFGHPVLSIVETGSYDKFDKSRMTTGQTKVINVSSKVDFRKNFKVTKTYFVSK